jgi:NADH dehydrogenase
MLNPSDIAYPLRKVFRNSPNVRFRQGAVAAIERDRRIVRLGDGTEISYDRLVLATGSVNNYFGNPGVARHTLGMKQLSEAMRLRNHVLSCLEMAAREQDPHERLRWLTFVVVGGGPTGVEYAGALMELLRLVLGRDYPELAIADAKVVLVEGHARLLGQFPSRLGGYALEILRRRGIEVKLSTLVQDAAADTVTLSSGEIIPCRSVVWSAGVRSNDPLNEAAIARSRSHRLQVDEHLRVIGADGVFAIGDAAAVSWHDGEIAMLSAPAMQEGRYVARLIRDEVRRRPGAARPFRYLDKGVMATIGRNAAVAQIGALSLRGFIGWIGWLTVHIYYLIGFRNRLAVLASWGWNYLKKDRAIRIIARSDEDRLVDRIEGVS